MFFGRLILTEFSQLFYSFGAKKVVFIMVFQGYIYNVLQFYVIFCALSSHVQAVSSLKLFLV